ncbi:vomeronasal type-2 receptor 26-like [Hyla sarda]|uniref:vomeronasal type-2 receptor 26-like n=1 Tax=Hyla sarda TaxID=327740 RepID=UPI0024C33484|nr:vomeronasal type-2 receptor 26-like [Hyla sarda]
MSMISVIDGRLFKSGIQAWSNLIPDRTHQSAHPREYTHLRAFLFAIEEINNSSDILPNVTLGYHIYDSCGHENKVIKDVLQILSGHTVTAPNYSCMENDAVVGFIGDLQSGTTLPMAQLLSLYGYTQISYGAREPLLSDKKLYPKFFRTVPSDKIQYSAFVKLLERFQWNWVGIITSDDDSGRRELQELVKLFTSHQICIEFTILVSLNIWNYLPPALQTSSTDVIIICGSYSMTYIKFLYHVAHVLKNKTLILPSSWSLAIELIIDSERDVPANCSLVFSASGYNITRKKFFNIFKISGRPSDALLEDIWMTTIHCFSGNTLKDTLIPLVDRNPYRHCSDDEIPDININFVKDTTPYQVYMGVNIMAQALHKVNIFLNENRKLNISKMYGYKSRLTQYIKEERTFFNENGDWITPLDILNWVRFKEISRTPVGTFDASSPEDKQLYINPQIIKWRHELIPKGRCSEPCLPGARKVLREGYLICCYDCVPCPEGEFSNYFDTENCQRCPEDEWPNDGKNKCVKRDYEFLSYETDVVTLVFSIISILLFFKTVFIIGIFILFWKSPIVRANNRNLSFILLTSLMFSLLCVFLFIGRPVDITCMLRQIFFGIFFTVAVSSVLAKTIIVCIAFKATRPDSSWRKCVGVKLPYSVVLVCSSLQILNAVIWLSLSPPYQELNLDYPGKIIIQCNEGSVLAFYLMLGYMGFLAAVSFVLAFMVRTLPDIYNEAKYITFSMLVFCSVWIGAIPAYLSSTGKHMVTVEIFAILASGGGNLICMFLPKCYNILINPELNSKGHLFQKSVM